jgi:ABC-type multidrug transport system ATPase subunit
VLREVTLRVAAGEAVAVFGPNGAGKSTLLRLCATLCRPTSGTLRWFGDEAAGPAVRRRIGVVAHQSFCYPDLTASENLSFFARAYDLPSPERVARDWLERIDLAEVADRPLRVLSRGMEQRLALARALLHAPDLLLLDEPWSGLDARAADALTALLGTAKRERRAVVVVTHDVERGLAIADRACILHRGRLAWEGTVTDGARAMLDDAYRRVTASEAA